MTETKKIKINLDKESYDIHIGANLSDEIPNIVSKLTSKNKVFLICDESLGSLILPQVKNSLSKAGFEIFVCFVKSVKVVKVLKFLKKQ